MKHLFHINKPNAITAVLLLLCFLSSCSQKSYEAGYEEGCNYGFNEGYYDGWDDGYSEGLYDGRHDITADDILFWHTDIRDEVLRYAEHEAAVYASRKGNWHPEEAWGVIEAYRNREPFYENGAAPSYQDYLDAVDSLIYFYEYFYGSHYE